MEDASGRFSSPARRPFSHTRWSTPVARYLVPFAIAAALLVALAAEPAPPSQRTERAILAGGCFWGVQDLLRRYPGVISTRVGYTGGEVPNATYRNHGNHAEAIEITFDPQTISYRKLLEFFFHIL